MPNIVLKDRIGEEITYENVQQIVVKDTDGNYVYYSLGGGGIGNVTVLTLNNYNDSHEAALATIIDPSVGDMAIIKAPITSTPLIDDLWEYTAYVFTEITVGVEGWQAMDGNYSMDNVFLSKDIITTTSVGFITSGTTIEKGTSMKSFMQTMLQQKLNPQITQPSFTCTYNISATGQSSSTDVQGAQCTPKLKVLLNPGNYQYGPTPTGVNLTAGTIDGIARAISNNQMNATFAEITLSNETKNYSKNYTYTYSDGLIPYNNVEEPYPAGQIHGASGSATASANLMSGVLNTTKPTISISTGSISNNLEVGSTANPQYTITINNPNGVYPYGHIVGTKGSSESAQLVVSNRSKTVDGTSSSFSGNTETGNWGVITVGDSSSSKAISASCSYSASPNIPVSQYGNAVPIAQISAGSASNSGTLSIPSGYRQIFWGYAMVKTGITSEHIRTLIGHKKNASLVNENLAEDTSKVSIIIAAPKNTRSLTSVVMPSSSMADVTSQFVKQSNSISVEGANGYTGIDYDVWVYAPATMGGTYRINMA